MGLRFRGVGNRRLAGRRGSPPSPVRGQVLTGGRSRPDEEEMGTDAANAPAVRDLDPAAW
jgi:hypothetical protein